MRNAAILITMQLVLTAACLCQIKIPLTDISAAGSPVRISGSVLFGDSSSMALRSVYVPEGLVTNVSGKGIVLTVLHIGVVIDYTIAVDRFFGLNLDPGRNEGIDPTATKFEPLQNARLPPAEAGSDAKPSATAQLIFIQFADGSTWGDPDVGRKQFLLRRRSLQELHRLEKVLDEKGEPGLKAELSRVDQFQSPAVDSLVDACANKATSCLADTLRSQLKQANLRQSEMGIATSE